MYFAIICLDKPDGGPLRAENRPAHLAYIKASADKVLIGGPLLSENGQNSVGSLLVMEFADLAEARAFADGDPYKQAGVFESVTIKPWRQVFPQA